MEQHLVQSSDLLDGARETLVLQAKIVIELAVRKVY